MDVLAPLKALDRFQRRHRTTAIPIAVIKKFSDDQGGNLAALIAYYGFFSLFPLLLVFVSVLGFVLDGDPHARQMILDSALKDFPIIGDQLGSGTLTGNGTALIVGFLGALLGGLGVTLAAQTAFNRVHGVALRDRPGFLPARLRGLGLLAVLGVLQIASTVAAGLVSGGLGGPLLVVAGLAVSLVVNFVLFWAAFRLLTDASVPTRGLRPGILLATTVWTALQAVGGAYIGHVVKSAGATYGAFATVIGLLTWLFLGARVVVIAAELNSVVAGTLWPRSLFDPPEPADRRVLTTLATIDERRDGQHVAVWFGEAGDPTLPDAPGRDVP